MEHGISLKNSHRAKKDSEKKVPRKKAPWKKMKKNSRKKVSWKKGPWKVLEYLFSTVWCMWGRLIAFFRYFFPATFFLEICFYILMKHGISLKNSHCAEKGSEKKVPRKKTPWKKMKKIHEKKLSWKKDSLKSPRMSFFHSLVYVRLS